MKCEQNAYIILWGKKKSSIKTDVRPSGWLFNFVLQMKNPKHLSNCSILKQNHDVREVPQRS